MFPLRKLLTATYTQPGPAQTIPAP